MHPPLPFVQLKQRVHARMAAYVDLMSAVSSLGNAKQWHELLYLTFKYYFEC